MASKRTGDVDKVRNRIVELKAKIKAAQKMQSTKAVAYERADSFVDDLAEAGGIDGGSFTDSEYSRPIFRDSDDVIRFLAWIGRDQIKEKLRLAIDDNYAGYDGSLDIAETHIAIAADAEALFDLEVEEERLIMATEAEGQPIRRRTDADPRAVLAAH